ncbi:MAG: hypothetical protein A3B47_02555 [Candidatus Levybacteria bacterium RIFCSPLOWO2_01_FULL_39_24]|nr:MAG: hypothetical protein A2800_01850 [Candidatus Levybacteria bacterium RIFCSPHIGHO2_01_FULL_40_16]OGH28262.1 MAG: hypothetical protein A3E12_02000 [Candidatus Levybacteria bacterium RIFCSPHIGHO2_12_FULL_39_9]OGH46506.1 MAG: hypothetical protein A3B47_02555 [Candidatus Levybacteria bacterium RIFCSPLOWO2_01_FULL_39_24]
MTEEREKIIEINFGKSDWVRSRPDTSSYGDNIIQISENATFSTLPPWVTKEYDSLMRLPAQETAVLGHSAISIKRERLAVMNEDYELIFIWVKNRNEWAVISHRTWIEGSYLNDESFDGPFALDEMCANKILEAYAAPNQKFTLDEVRRMSPEKLKLNAEKDDPEDDPTKPVGDRIKTAVEKFLKGHPDYKFKHENTSTYHSGYESSDDRDERWLETISRPDTQKKLYIFYSILGRDLPHGNIEWDEKSQTYSSFIEGNGPEDPSLTNLFDKLQVIIINPKPVDKV